MGGVFTVHADFNRIDGGRTLTRSVDISMNTQVVGDDGVIYENGPSDVVDGVLQVQLPASDNEPFDFGFTIRRTTGLTKTWRVPTHAPNVTVELTDFTATTPLPLPATGDAVSQTDFDNALADLEAGLTASYVALSATEPTDLNVKVYVDVSVVPPVLKGRNSAGVFVPLGGNAVTFVDNGDGTASLTGVGVVDNGDGTYSLTGSNVTDNGDGTYSIAA